MAKGRFPSDGVGVRAATARSSDGAANGERPRGIVIADRAGPRGPASGRRGAQSVRPACPLRVTEVPASDSSTFVTHQLSSPAKRVIPAWNSS